MRLIIIIILFCTTRLSFGQGNMYLDDLKALRVVLEKTPSYKKQMKGEKLIAYNALYKQLTLNVVNDANEYQYFYNLSRLFFPLRDNHLAFYQLADYKNFQTNESIEKFVTSREFKSQETYSGNIDSLEKQSAAKPLDPIEGIYHYGTHFSVALFKANSKEYTGVVVKSAIKLWQKGQVAFRLYEQTPGFFKAIYIHPFTKNFILNSNEKFRNHSLINSQFYSFYKGVYSKKLGETDHSNLPANTNKFALRNINTSVQYLLVKTFQRNNVTSKIAASFYDSIKNLLTAPNLILDLRNNEGGAKSETKNLFKILKKYATKNRLYVLVNNETISQAEIFTLRLMQLKNVMTVGQPTKGMLAYGSNFGKRVQLPSKKFEVYITDMGGSKQRLSYEDRGIDPQILLHNNSPWVEQVVTIVNSQTN